jgi:hypothetical protein
MIVAWVRRDLCAGHVRRERGRRLAERAEKQFGSNHDVALIRTLRRPKFWNPSDLR